MLALAAGSSRGQGNSARPFRVQNVKPAPLLARAEPLRIGNRVAQQRANQVHGNLIGSEEDDVEVPGAVGS